MTQCPVILPRLPISLRAFSSRLQLAKMISTSTVFHGTARFTITGVLAVSFFKKAAVDHAAKVLHKAEKVTIITLGLAAADLCLSTVILVLASDRTARKLLNGDFNKPNDNSPPLSSENIPDTSTPPPSPLTDSTVYTPPFTGTTPIQRQKRFSVDSHTTLIADDDDDFIDFDNLSDPKLCFGKESEHGILPATFDNSDPRFDTHRTIPDLPLPGASTTTTTAIFLTGDTPPQQSITPPPKPPDTILIVNRRKQQHRSRLRAARARTYIGHLEQLHNEIVIDKAALVDGWADAMAKLGLTSMLSLASSIPNTH